MKNDAKNWKPKKPFQKIHSVPEKALAAIVLPSWGGLATLILCCVISCLNEFNILFKHDCYLTVKMYNFAKCHIFVWIVVIWNDACKNIELLDI